MGGDGERQVKLECYAALYIIDHLLIYIHVGPYKIDISRYKVKGQQQQ